MQYVDFDEVSKLRILLRTEKPILFLWVVNNMTIRKKFPNKTVIFMLLEHILVRIHFLNNGFTSTDLLIYYSDNK